MRINKYIAHAGIASRRKAEELIKQGLVTVNGQVIRELATTIKSGDRVEVNGQPIYNEEKVYYLLNKPRGVISSVTDDKGRPTVVDLLPNVTERIYPVGRLDWDTSGALILTNDGDFTDEMIHPRNEIDKVYVARVKGVADKEILRPLTKGVKIDGKKTKPAVYEILKVDPVKNRSIIQLTIHEGRNHQVKKMFEAVGLQVDKLSRTQFGHLNLTGLRPGEARRLNKKEVSQLHNLAVTKKNNEKSSYRANPFLSKIYLTGFSTFLSLSANLLKLHDSSDRKTWHQGFVDGDCTYFALPSMGERRR
ncbi:16S rRNA uridine-516 pseudouridylate synthase [Streptococcus constellatus subsp. pharyngis SK1060 = CCUG 46377]|uniref:Pseudouridine synthase n=1 Tax=Streptococcus constellatus subsp. pharyngis SK1060 = CCUG 46377 TaxID=1035184 RepID=U2YDB4_STRCV|nr:16S rRNA uridine-516 pseudouridylate synthase [Streptococcus constellatus subsp. pharyngis SK1060 = CCUG 46377]